MKPRFVQELLGHADISLTLNTYSHVLPDMDDGAAEAMDVALAAPVTKVTRLRT